ncbi:hypothetical protein AC481_02795 [miscellaneous Crenarchaeota group archaeon SMTZ-80]|nr:MAG: hypothetical protein AC481_02795 [miscellaneous Crenarchaeota group archaeon SMTZ-80]
MHPIANEKIERRSLANLFSSKIRNFKQAFFKIPAPTFLHYGCLCLILLLAIIIRILPMRYGFYLSEFDPYFQYRITNHLVENGFSSYFNWHDDISWYPWGRTVYLTSYPGVAFTTALLYTFLELIGMELTVYQLCIIFPVMMGVATCFVIYLLGKDIGGKSVGLLSALFLAFNSSHMFRTSLGFFDDETIGMFAMILSFFFYLRALQPQRSIRSNIFYSLLSGLSLSYLSFSWGAFRYPISLIALFSFIILIIGRYSSKLLITYGTTFGLTFLAMSQTPNLGYAFFKEWPTLGVLAIFLILVIKDISGRINKPVIKTGLIFGTFLFLIISALFLWQSGLITSLAGRFQSVLNPSTRIEMPIVESVAEHRLATWATFFHEFGMLSLIGIFGFYFILQKSREKDIFLILFGITSLYFASSLVRLSIIFAPAILILAAITLTELGKPSVDIIRGTIIFPKRKMRFISRVGKEYGVAIILILILLIIPTINGAVEAAGTPATIATSSLPIVTQQPQDWLEAIAWMKANLDENAVVMAWWDYGYWITTIAGKHTLADNGTINSTQIAIIARAFLSNETEAIPILKKYGVSNVAILVTWYSEEEQLRFYGYGEDSKWYWMARISNNTEYDGETVRYFSNQVGEGEDAYIKYDRVISVDNKIISNKTIVDKSGLNRSTVLGYLMHNGIIPSEVKTSEFFDLEFTSSNRFVFVYSVDYPESTMISSSLSKNLVTYNQSVTISGKLIDPKKIGIPDSTIILQYSLNKSTDWVDMEAVSTNDSGEYKFEWIPDGGDYLIRTKFNGVSGSYLSSISSNQTLTVMKSSGSLEVTLSPSTLTFGESVEISCKFIPVTTGGSVYLGYSSDGDNWFNIGYGDLMNGSFSFTWTPEYTGEFLIQAVWEGNSNFNEANSEQHILTIVEE